MSDKKEPKIDPEIAVLKARINNLEGMMEIVDKKARINGEVSDALFNVVRRYRLYKRDGK
jgi:hypothetical protein